MKAIKHITALIRFTAFTLLWATGAQAVPSSITCPVDGPVEITTITKNRTSGLWDFHQQATKEHSISGGIGGADDRLAYDANLTIGSNIYADTGLPVYAIADGYIDTSVYGWGGPSFNQVLIRHKDATGATYYSGMLHMSNIITRTNGKFVSAGTILGYISNVGVPDRNNHLHFAVYDMLKGKLTSRNTKLEETTAAKRTNHPPSSSSVGIGQSLGDVTVAFRAFDEDGDGMLYEAALNNQSGASVSPRRVGNVSYGYGTATFQANQLTTLTQGTTYTLSLTIIDSKGARGVVSRAATIVFNRNTIGSGSVAMDHFANYNLTALGAWTGTMSTDATFIYRTYRSGNMLAQRKGTSEVWYTNAGRWNNARIW